MSTFLTDARIGGHMGTMNELPNFLTCYLFRSLIPTILLALAKLMGQLPISWSWVILPTASALFFMGSFLLAGAIVKTAHAMAMRRS
jgi:hypothetical protein